MSSDESKATTKPAKSEMNVFGGSYEELLSPVTDADFPPDTDPRLKEALKCGYECHLDDLNLLKADPPNWHPWTSLCDWYGMHIETLKSDFQMLRHVPESHSHRLRNKFVIQWSKRVEPYRVAIRAYLHRIVAERPEHAAVVDNMLKDIMCGPTTTWGTNKPLRDDWSKVDQAYASVRTFIESYYNTHHGGTPLGRPVPRYQPNGGEVAWWDWCWIPAHEPSKITSSDEHASKDAGWPDGKWRKASWYRAATAGLLMPDAIRKAGNRNSVKRHRLADGDDWRYEANSIMANWPEHHDVILKQLASEEE